jgi:hypothetical protein
MADYYDGAKHGAILAIPFSLTNVTTEAANVDMVLPSSSASTLHVMPHAGSVVGISVRAAGAITAGGISARVHKAGTELADYGYPLPVCDATNQASYANVAPGAITFSAGDSLGLSVSATTTALDPTNTLDVDGLLFVQLNPK